MNMAMRSCNPNASKHETNRHLLPLRLNLLVVAREPFIIFFVFSSFSSYPITNNDDSKKTLPIRIRAATAEEIYSTSNVTSISDVKGAGTTARGRRLLKVREEKRKRENSDRYHNDPAWTKVLGNACKGDMELREALGDTIRNYEKFLAIALVHQRTTNRV